MFGVPGVCLECLEVFRGSNRVLKNVPGSSRECMEDPRVLRESGVTVMEWYEGGWSAGVCKYV